MADQLTLEIISAINKLVKAENGERTTVGLGEITTDTELTSLGIDSLGLADVLWDLEQIYGIKIEMNTADAWSNLNNIGDVVEAVRGLLTKEV
ncbi:acyl carrier protein [Rhizobium leguminosarum]|uniref:acyl carrier protein n=1 Tax=Rhizobium leguminosarum TaxID=384 RepID=UPI001A915CEA|nr:acyl carrier protein [Rhizobium leguminosarum]MBY5412954.1 acyl carrier protein [Rhizobium leguminosarum]MBY5523458.1 acyl carrier protein [Rhizobium leguminosarum]MBY5544784.1 acyl carrier protein [Rhizobium leguminosarum]MBY5551923.1 acyl carrier protein [Rhizobium leguminosarum]MBY5558628.1 acyl carrier protein [Rhizobium leguminosarum]